jgi:hypothetical protein
MTKISLEKKIFFFSFATLVSAVLLADVNVNTDPFVSLFLHCGGKLDLSH